MLSIKELMHTDKIVARYMWLMSCSIETDRSLTKIQMLNKCYPIYLWLSTSLI